MSEINRKNMANLSLITILRSMSITVLLHLILMKEQLLGQELQS